jgi:hypothetical protein
LRKYFIIVLLPLLSLTARADLFGGDLPLLAQIVTNTLNTIMELQKQRQLMEDQMAGIRDRIDRIRTINDLVQPSQWDQWKKPEEAVRRLGIIYRTLPKEYRSEKADLIETELANAMNLIARVKSESVTNYNSGKELEARALGSSPGVSQKLAASGVGTLISLESQSQVIQSHVVSLLTQMLAEGHENENRLVMSKGQSYSTVSGSLKNKSNRFSELVLGKGVF